MWTNGYNAFGGIQQRDLQSNNWLSQSLLGGFGTTYPPRIDNQLLGASNPFASQLYGSTYQPYNNFGYQFRGW